MKLSEYFIFGVMFIIVAYLVTSGMGECLREPEQDLTWVKMELTDKQIISHNSILGSYNEYYMAFKSGTHGVMTYNAISPEEYALYNVGQTCEVGLDKHGGIGAAHRGNDYGQFYHAIY